MHVSITEKTNRRLFSTKENNLVNLRFSTFLETSKLDQLREITDTSLDFIEMSHSKEETQKEVTILEKQLIELRPYITALNSVMTFFWRLKNIEH
ncbi:hypothetical protein [Acinetobacter baumannii]|uniref:hypothetical protein n=1 Tax=Acinetobacter baumannii TaxID=470 RepID=UPI000AAB3E32|nr:hypothetical protein [Acinetobacter baumannii]MCL8265042.1 hypothetical protein [Acinetobacter baumannii]MDC5544115.1 hypothetical protein [Acinetobacter baumannii]MDP7720324.1 hypothetical protein [Acinetobacter baumannii]MDP7803435.1 hypothetical protein [Acinetobacter baumannii]MDP7886161.1 hypothetical protein [Acinetobacter baumannii]